MVLKPEWISAIAEVVTALGVALAYLQLRDSHEQARSAKDSLESLRQSAADDHERSRREGAVQYLLVWTNSMTRALSSATRLVEKLDFETCKRIEQKQGVGIDKDLVGLLTPCFPPDTKFEERADGVWLNAQQTAEFRALLVKYLNTLETNLCAWLYSAVDKEIIELEFKYLLEPTEGRNVVKFFRQAIGESSYPAIAAFEHSMAERKSADLRNTGRGPLGARN